MKKLVLLYACIFLIGTGTFAQSSRYRFGFSVYPNFSNSLHPVSDAPSKDYESGIFSLSAGGFSEYTISSSLHLQLGINVAGPGYRLPKHASTEGDPESSIRIKARFIAHCLEVPLNVVWHPVSGKRLFTTAGLSAYFPFAESRLFKITYEDGTYVTGRRRNYDFAFGYGLQLGMGTSVKLFRSMDLDIVPEIKLMQVDHTSSFLSQYLQAGIKLAVRV